MSHRPRLLLVEDEPDLRATLADFLASEGYDVAEAEHGAAALAWLRTHSIPDAVLVDLAMPVMNGLRFRTEQLADPVLATAPAVALTARRTRAEELAEFGFAAVLHKPVDVSALLTTLAALCRGRADAAGQDRGEGADR